MIRNLAFIFLFSISCFVCKAQNWGGGIDNEDYNFGFTFQYVASEYKIIKTRDWRNPYIDQQLNNRPVTDSLLSVSSPLSPGFGVGFVINKYLTNNVDLRFTPGLVFGDRMIEYKYQPGPNNTTFTEKQQKVSATNIELPLGFKIKSDRQTNFRAYMLLGAKYSIDMASSKKTADQDANAIDKLLKNKKTFFSYEAGIGFDLYFEYFKMSPEIKISHSLKDILIHDNTPYSNPIDRAILRNFTFSLFFE